MIYYYDGADNLTETYPKSSPRDFNSNEKYYKRSIIMDENGDPIFEDPVMNENWVDETKLTEEKDSKKNDIKIEAYRRITQAALEGDIGTFLELIEWKQRNLTVRALDLIRKGLEIELSKDVITNLTQAEQDEFAAIEAAWEGVVDIRTKSGTIEADIDTKETIADVKNVKVKDNDEWIAE